MEKNIFLLEPNENSRVVKIFQLVLGLLCIGISIFWAIFYFKTPASAGRMWITIVFLASFGFYQVMAGLGKTSRFIETGPDKIKIKQHSFLPSVELKPEDIESIRIFPFSIAFRLKNRKNPVLRFGISYPELIAPIKKAAEEFAEINKIPFEEKTEEI